MVLTTRSRKTNLEHKEPFFHLKVPAVDHYFSLAVHGSSHSFPEPLWSLSLTSPRRALPSACQRIVGVHCLFLK